MHLFECYKTHNIREDAITSFFCIFLLIAWLWKKHLFWSELQQKIFVPVGFVMDNFCYTLLFSPPGFFPFFSCWKMKAKGRWEEKQASKQNPLPRLQIQTKRSHWGVGGVKDNSWAGRACLRFDSLWEDLILCVCVCMDFSTFWINENTKTQIRILLFFFPHQEIIPIGW